MKWMRVSVWVVLLSCVLSVAQSHPEETVDDTPMRLRYRVDVAQNISDVAQNISDVSDAGHTSTTLNPLLGELLVIFLGISFLILLIWLKKEKTDSPSSRSKKSISASADNKSSSEMEELNGKRWENNEGESGGVHPDDIGLAFSGGGIRSASFCSGVLMKFMTEKPDKVKYISCVSGGGYIGSAFIQRLYWHKRNHDGALTVADYSPIMEQLIKDMKRNVGFLFSFTPYNICKDKYSNIVMNGVRGFLGSIRGLLDIVVLIGVLVIWILAVILSVLSFAFPMASAISSVVDFTDAWSVVLCYIVLGCILVLAFILKCATSACSFPSITRSLNMLLIIISACLLFVTEALIMNQLSETEVVDDTSSIFVLALPFVLRLLPAQYSSYVRSSHLGLVLVGVAYGRVLCWKEYNKPFLFIPSANTLLTGEYTYYQVSYLVAIVSIFLHAPLCAIKDGIWASYYRWRLQYAFYTETGRCGMTGMFEWLPKCISRSCGKAVELQDVTDLPIQYISNTTVNLWQKYKDKDTSDIVAISSEGWLRVSGPAATLAPAPAPVQSDVINNAANDSHQRYQPINMQLSEAMATSAAAVSFNLGVQDGALSSKISLFSIFGLGLGKWVRLRKYLFWNCSFIEATTVLSWSLNIWFFLCFLPVWDYWMTIVGCGVMTLSLCFMAYSHQNAAFYLAFPFYRTLSHMLPMIYVGEDHPSMMYLSDGGHYENMALLPLLEKRLKNIVIVDGSEDITQDCAELDRVLELARLKLGVMFYHDLHCDLDYAQLYTFRDIKKRRFTFFVRYTDGSSGTVTYLKPRADSDKELGQNKGGCCCECCHRDCCCCCSDWTFCGVTNQFHSFPNHSTGMQFFTPTLFEMYHNEGLRAAHAAINPAANESEYRLVMHNL